MEVRLPNRLDRVNMYKLINQTINSDFLPVADEFEFNFQTLSFIEPVGVTVLSNLTEWLMKRNVKLRWTGPSDQNIPYHDAICYLDDSAFFKRYLGKSLRKFATVRGTTIPLELVSYSDSYQWLEKTIFWLSRKLNITPQSLVNIKVCMEEVFNNINDHSQENIGCVFAQHYPNLKLVRIAISDFGVGIPYNINKVRPGIQDSEAILLATEQGFSTKSNPKNRGAGLDTLIYNVVNNLQGNVYIHSNHGILNCTYTSSGTTKQTQNHSGFYPGTLLEIVFRTDAIENITDSEEEFEW